MELRFSVHSLPVSGPIQLVASTSCRLLPEVGQLLSVVIAPHLIHAASLLALTIAIAPSSYLTAVYSLLSTVIFLDTKSKVLFFTVLFKILQLLGGSSEGGGGGERSPE